MFCGLQNFAWLFIIFLGGWTYPLSNVCFLFLCLLAEVTVPLSLKEVGGYIEKQVAYLSGEGSFTEHLIWPLLFGFLVAKVKLWNLTDCPFIFFLPGGRGEDSSVIITLPECSAFSDIPEEALAKVFTYLTLIPRCVLLCLFLSGSLSLSLFCSAPKSPPLVFWAQLASSALRSLCQMSSSRPLRPEPHSCRLD